MSPRPWPRLLALLLLVSVAPAARATFGLTLGDHRVFFLEPSLSPQEGELDAVLDTISPDLEFEQFEGSSLGAAYGFAVHTAGDDLKARWDTYRVRAGLTPGPMRLLGAPLRLGFGLRAGAELRFLRHYATGEEAATALPMEPWMLRSAESVLERMRPGDMATFPVDAELLLQASLKTPLHGIPTRSSVFVKLRGTFQMSLLRLLDEKVRVRFLSTRARESGAAFKARLFWDLEILELLGQEVRFLTELDVLKASWIRRHGRGFLMDATLDLADPDARGAFETLLHRPVRFATGEGALMSVGWTQVQQLAAEDAAREPEERRAHLHRCGMMRFRQKAWKMKLGNSFLRWGRRELTTRLEFEPYRDDEPPILMASNLSRGKTTVLFRQLSKWYRTSQAFGYREGERVRPVMWRHRYRVKDRRFRQSDIDDVRRRARYFLGPDYVPELPDLPEGEAVYGKADLRVGFSAAALEALARYDERALEDQFERWLEHCDAEVLWKQGHAADMMLLPRELRYALVRAVERPDADTLRLLAELRDTNRAFGEMGPGFMLYLLQPEADDPRVSVSFRVKDAHNGNTRLRHGALQAEPAEELKPLMRFLETGILELQAQAAAVALEAREGGAD